MLIVVKIGGDLIQNDLKCLIKDLSCVLEDNKVILVHGGADVVTEISKKLGYEPRFVVSSQGFKSRFTSFEESFIYNMVMAGKINKSIVARLSENGVSSVGLSGVDCKIVTADRKKKLVIVDDRGKRMLIDGGYTGQITEIDHKIIDVLLKEDITPVIAPVAMGDDAMFLNVDGDRLAAKIAVKLKADRLISLTDVKGILINNQVIPSIRVSDSAQIMKHVENGMKVKLLSALEAVENGVELAFIASGYGDTPITNALKGIECSTIKK